jgi:pimeloyl-ACP methyl ester carboxylesterase
VPGGERLPLIVELEPGSISDLEATLADGKAHLESLGKPAVWLRPGGRGPGTVFQGYGAVDVFEAIAAASTRFPIDPDRISLYGFSMGGAGVWYLATHFPDRFAAIAPLAGYNDYRLWKRPGGMTFPLQLWEEPSWEARSAIFLLENLRNTAIWMVHGKWDRAVGGGVDVEHARQSARALDELGIPYRLTELPATGHDRRFMREPFFGEVLGYLIERRRPQAPPAITFRTYDLHHTRCYWLEIKQQQRYGVFSRVSATVGTDEITIDTENVRHLSLEAPPTPAHAARLVIDGQPLATGDLHGTLGLRQTDDGQWRNADANPPADEKHPQVAGPFGALFERGTVLVRGTIGPDEEAFFLEWSSRDAAKFFKDTNGGVHRGGIPGVNWVDLPIMADTDWLATAAGPNPSNANVLAYGTPRSNALLAAYAGELKVAVEDGEIRVGDRVFSGPGLGVIAVGPFPDGSPRYLAIHGGTSPDAITSGAHLNLQLLPDYLVYNATDVLEWGFFDSEWRPVPGGAA